MVSVRAYVALDWRFVFDLSGWFLSASRDFRQDSQVVAEDRAADRRGEILKTAKTAAGESKGAL